MDSQNIKHRAKIIQEDIKYGERYNIESKNIYSGERAKKKTQQQQNNNNNKTHTHTHTHGERGGSVWSVGLRSERSGVRDLPPPCCVLEQDTLLPESTG